MGAETLTKLAHPACGCVTEDSDYSGQSGKEAGDLTEIPCHCGHSGCQH
jgi:hypothetical protein